MTFLGFHITRIGRPRPTTAALVLSPEQADIVSGAAPAPRVVDLAAEHVVGFRTGNRRGVPEGWGSSR